MCFRGLLEGYWKDGIFLTLEISEIVSLTLPCAERRGPVEERGCVFWKRLWGPAPDLGLCLRPEVFEVSGTEHEPEFRG